MPTLDGHLLLPPMFLLNITLYYKTPRVDLFGEGVGFRGHSLRLKLFQKSDIQIKNNLWIMLIMKCTKY